MLAINRRTQKRRERGRGLLRQRLGLAALAGSVERERVASDLEVVGKDGLGEHLIDHASLKIRNRAAAIADKMVPVLGVRGPRGGLVAVKTLSKLGSGEQL